MSKAFKVKPGTGGGILAWEITLHGKHFDYAPSLRDALAEINAAITLAEDGRYDMPKVAPAVLSFNITNVSAASAVEDTSASIAREISKIVRAEMRRASQNGYRV